MTVAIYLFIYLDEVFFLSFLLEAIVSSYSAFKFAEEISVENERKSISFFFAVE